MESKISAYIIRSGSYAVFLSVAFIALSSASNSPKIWHKSAGTTAVYDTTARTLSQPRAISFAERVAFQRAIDIPNALANPTLELHDHTGALIASNDNWQHTIIDGIITTSQDHDITNSGYAPGDPRESAIIAELPAGNYTAIVRGVNNTTGVALVEVYDLDQ
jgi:hypothetical protein